MLIIRKKNSWLPWRENLLLEASKDLEFSCDSFFGERVWHLRKGDKIIITVKRSEMKEVGDRLDFEYCVQKDWKGKMEIPWGWKYNLR